jgi:broad specificity phosphatase PhoE
MPPATVTAVRHGESEGNAASLAAGDRPLVFGKGDAETGLTGLGAAQASALGARLRADPPEIVWCSPYLRARQTWERVRAELAALAGAGPPPVAHLDERLRDREMGDLARLNWAAVRERHPQEHARAVTLGEYAYRAPGGECFADVAARMRAVLADLDERCAGRRVLVVAHDAVVLMLKHVIEDLPLDGMGRYAPVHNASVSTWRAVDGRLRPGLYNDISHLRA